MKRCIWIFATITVIVLICVTGFLWYQGQFRAEYGGEIIVNAEKNNPANQFQPYTDLRLTVSGNQLYFHLPDWYSERIYTDWLCKVNYGRIERICRINNNVEAYGDTVCYYRLENWDQTKTEYTIHLYDIPSKTEQVFSISENLYGGHFTTEGDLIIPIESEENRYVLCKDGEYEKIDAKTVGFKVQEKIYCLEYLQEYEEKRVVCYDQEGNREVLDIFPDWSSAIHLIPCDYGLLLHNYEESGSILYLVDEETGEIRELFNVPGMDCNSTINAWGNYVFISFERWEKFGEKGMLKYENDQMEGTWRIDLTDGTKEKISNSVYCGLYIFDDSGIFACAEEGKDMLLYKLDFDGNVLFQILK